MGVDVIVDFPCEPKRACGTGPEGTVALLARIKAANRAEAIAATARKIGRDPRTMSVTVSIVGPDGPKESTVTVAELLAQSEPLKALAPTCAGCPARSSDVAFGCIGYVNYPLSSIAERWLVDRVQPIDALGGYLCAKAMKDFKYDGAPVQRMRARKLLESPRAVEKVLNKGWFSSDTVNGDQLLQAVWCVGPLRPTHCAMVLLWLGALAIDGVVPATADPSALALILSLADPAERGKRTSLSLGAVPPDAAGLAAMLTAAYRAWVLGVDVLVDA